jgi:hypothetical protein
MAADWQPAIFATSVEAPRLLDVPIYRDFDFGLSLGAA